MKFVIVSDSHGDTKLLNEIVLKNQDADIFIHLGDYEIPDYFLSRFLCVKGNCDFSSLNKKEYTIQYDFGKIHIEHGNQIDFSNFDEYVLSKNVDIFLFGHLHKKMAFKIENTYVFNPGSLTYPRDSNKGSYLILNVTKDKIDYKFIDVEL